MSELSEPTTSVTVSLRTPAELVASLPALLGFTPTESLVAIALCERGGRFRVGGIARSDLPETTQDAVALAETLLRRLAAAGPARVQLIVVTNQLEHPDLGAPPEAGLVEMFSATFAAEGIETRMPLWTARIAAGARWRCYEACACTGVLPDPGATTTAAHTALAGRVTYRSRDEAEAALAPDPDAASPGRRERLDAAHHAARAAVVADPAAAARADLDAIRAAITATAAGEPLAEDALARIVVALGRPAVRDVCLGFALGCDTTVDPAAARALWRRLTQATPAPEVAEPATLLAFAALHDGGGVTLSVALERARRADPDHQLSLLLDHILDAGITPDQVKDMLLGAVAEAEQFSTVPG